MMQISNHKLNVFAEFTDPVLEKEYLQDFTRYSARFFGPICLVSAFVYMLFGIMDFRAAADMFSLVAILTMRALFFLLALALYVRIRKSANYSRFCGWVTAFEALAVLTFFISLHLYSNVPFTSYLSALSLTLIIYIIPNRLRNAQIITFILNVAYFVLFYSRLEDIPISLGALIFYTVVFYGVGNISAYTTNLYKRKQFLDSRELLKMYMTDPLTGIANRVKFDQDLQKWINFCKRYDEPLSLIIFDVDDFKKINDSLGHLNGDQVVQNITKLFQSMIRNTDVFARWGGDEFALLLPGINVYQSIEVARRLKTGLEDYCSNKDTQVTCSFGIASFEKVDDARSFLLRADKMLYLAKNQGKNAIVWSDNHDEVSSILE